jgi:tetratricopeptide (TPR) repeat protein
MAEDNFTNEELGRFEEKYARILSQDPSSVAFIFLAQVLHKQGKVDKAINVLINGLRYNKKSVTGRFLLGKIYYDRWLIEQAKREFQTVVQLAPDNLAACKMLAQIYKSEEAFEKAREILRAASAYHPHDETILSELNEIEDSLSSVKKKEAEFQVARENIKTALDSKSIEELEKSIKKYDKELYTETVADIYFDQGLFDKSLAVLEAILQNNPGNDELRKKLEQSRLFLINRTAGFIKGE